MINTIQIIILLQGIFLAFALLKHKEKYKKTQFWLLICSIFAIVFYVIGDDDNHLFKEGSDWFLFDSSLFITFLFLFILYLNSENDKFNKKHYLFFIPNLIYFFIELFELITSREPLFIELLEFFNKLIFLSYLVFTIINLRKKQPKNWFLFFVIPITIILGIQLIDEIIIYFHFKGILVSEQTTNFYFLLIVALLFYFMTYYLINSPNNLLVKKAVTKYKNSNLSDECVKKYKAALINLMESERLYLDKKLTIGFVSRKLNIPKQYISEVLNVYMKTNFQDFVNNYRVEAFVNCLKNNQFANYSLLGIATEVGFNSKSSFNTTFKKFKGLTPSQFQKKLLLSPK